MYNYGQMVHATALGGAPRLFLSGVWGKLRKLKDNEYNNAIFQGILMET